ncbi:CGGC domain-containing protein [Maledivibacter halophilus]|uniref:Predicted metal-binding protein n=1 Tax=Maledivibacter halophilus TaxID=36842 RepID=A0A1T5IBR4_9FIRM|nr:CGGC domain-containing protein [Maledivibacter halophilus]SKC36555.1 Predicted metal-binding protein [Maledivibacter halophilus]
MEAKYIVIVQCDIAHRRCSGFACSNAFYNKEGMFDIYNNNTKYISFTCGGCCGKGIAAKLEHFSKKLKRKTDINKNEVVIHLSSCIVTDNHHYDRCPHIDYIKDIILKKGYKNLVEGSYISDNAEMKRKQGVYTSY